MMSMLSEYYKPIVLEEKYVFDPSQTYVQQKRDSAFSDYISYMKSLPINDKPDIFGLHDNADISYANNQTFFLLNTLLMLQPRSGGGGISREDVVEELAKDILAQLHETVSFQKFQSNNILNFRQSFSKRLSPNHYFHVEFQQNIVQCLF